jgi:hypothetical protein
MSVLIAHDLGLPPRREPLTVTQLRRQIARGASAAVLHRIAGSEADYRRLSAEYRLQGPAVRAAAPRPAPTVSTSAVAPPAPESPKTTSWERRARLMRFILGTAEAGLVLPETADLARELGLPTLAIEQDLLGLVRDGRVRVSSYWCVDHAVRRVELVGRNLFTALPPLDRPIEGVRPMTQEIRT